MKYIEREKQANTNLEFCILGNYPSKCKRHTFSDKNWKNLLPAGTSFARNIFKSLLDKRKITCQILYKEKSLKEGISESKIKHLSFIHDWLFVCFLSLSRATPMAYGGSQARGLIWAVATSLHHRHKQRGIWATSATYTIAHGNARSSTCWARPGIKPATSWFLVGFINHWATIGTPWLIEFFNNLFKIIIPTMSLIYG